MSGDVLRCMPILCEWGVGGFAFVLQQGLQYCSCQVLGAPHYTVEILTLEKWPLLRCTYISGFCTDSRFTPVTVIIIPPLQRNKDGTLMCCSRVLKHPFFTDPLSTLAVHKIFPAQKLQV